MAPAVRNDVAQRDDERLSAFIADVGTRVRAARLRKSLSRKALAERSGVSQRYLAQLEGGAGNISLAILLKLADTLNIHPPLLLPTDHSPVNRFEEFSALFLAAPLEAQEKALSLLLMAGKGARKAQRICLIGLRGAGKSTLGRFLARHLDAPFIELNSLIEEESGMAVGEFIALYGPEGYRRLEKQALETAIQQHEEIVLAAAGGVVSEPDTYEDLLSNFHTIWLKASPEEHMQRVRDQGDNRPMAGNPQAMAELKSLLIEREKLYARADALVDTSNRTEEASLRDVKRAASLLLNL